MSGLVKRVWSDVGGRAVVAVTAIVCTIVVGALLPLGADPRTATREIRLVARDMTFYLEGEDIENPVIQLRSGERVRVTLRNEDAGMTHNFAVKALGLAMDPLKGEGVRSIQFRVPRRPGLYQYLCRPHAQMMSGILEVVR